MKRFLLLVVVLLALAGCGEGGSRDAAIVSDQTSPYQLLISSSDLTPGRSRLVLTLWDGPQRLTDAQAMEVAILPLNEAGEAAKTVWEGSARSYDMGELQYWVAYPDFPAAGTYGVQAFVTGSDGERVENRALLQVKAEPDAPATGEPAPRSETRTLEDAPIEELTSAGPYVDRFYEMSVAAAAESGKPSLIVFATPGHCTSSLCSPVLDTIQQVSDEAGEGLNVVHVEIWRDFALSEMEPAVVEWGLQSEPWIFVLDEEGNVGARLDGPVSAEELREALAEVGGG